nr:hypothetical protein [Mycobacterium liflandii]
MAAAPGPPSPNNHPPACPAPPSTPATPAAPLPINSRPVNDSNGALTNGSSSSPAGLASQACPSVCTGSANT